MRTPRRPRKPTPLEQSVTSERMHGGEAEPHVLSDPTQDYVPTALVDSEDFAAQEYDDDDEYVPEDEYQPHAEDVPCDAVTLARNEPDAEDASSVSKPAELSERWQERQAEKRRIRLKRFMSIGGAITGVALTIWIFFFSPIFSYTFHDQDIQGLTEDSIVDRAKLADILRSHNGEQIFLFDDDALETAVIAALPEVSHISSSYKFPNSLTFTVQAQVPVACIVTDATCQAVAEDGTKLTIPADQLANLPKIGNLPAQLDQKLAMSGLMSVLETLPDDTRALVGQLVIDDHHLITLTLTDGRTVVWGTAENNEQKSIILAALLGQGARFIDISAPTAPVTSN